MVLVNMFASKKYTSLISNNQFAETYLVGKHPRKRNHSVRHAFFRYNFPLLFKYFPTTTSEPNRIQSKFNWVWLLRFLVRVWLCSISDLNWTLLFNQVQLRGQPFNSWGGEWVISGHQEFFSSNLILYYVKIKWCTTGRCENVSFLN